MRGLALISALAIGCGHPAGGDNGGDGGGAGSDTGGSTGSDAGGTGSDGNGSDGGGTGSDGGGTGSDGSMTGTDAGSSSGMDAASPGACGLAVCAKAFSSGTKGAALAVAVDSADNVYIAGLAESDLTFGTHTLFQVGSRDAFVVSFAADGTWRWGKRWGHSTTLVGAYGIAVDASNNIYIVGGMTGSIDFGGGYVGSQGMFVASFDASGNYRWARGDGGGSGLLGVATYGGTVYGIGRFLNTVTFSPTISLTSAGAEDVVVAAFATSDGSATWARRIGTAASDYEGGIVARAGAIAFTMSSGAVGSGEKLVSWTSAGADRWSTSLPAALDLRGLSVDPNANLYVSGLHTGGSDVPPNATYSSGDNEYVHAYADGGTSLWSWTLPETPAYSWQAIPFTPSAWNPAHELVLAGTYDGTLATGSGSLTGGRDTVFLASFTTSGTPVASRKVDDASTTAEEWVHGVAIDSHGTAYVVGQYYGTPNFGDGALPFASQGGVLVLRLAP